MLSDSIGYGNTTLQSCIRTRIRGRRVAVIQSGFCGIGVDSGRAIANEDEISEMDNGCIDCNVAGDLICIPGNLMNR